MHRLLRRPETRLGLTLIEIIVASLIGFFVAAGALLAFTTSVKIAESSSAEREAIFFAQQTLEGLRNHIACDNNDPQNLLDFNPATCSAAATAGPDALPVGPPAPGSILGFTAPARNVTITPGPDLDLDGNPDYYQARVTVSWTPPQ